MYSLNTINPQLLLSQPVAELKPKVHVIITSRKTKKEKYYEVNKDLINELLHNSSYNFHSSEIPNNYIFKIIYESEIKNCIVTQRVLNLILQNPNIVEVKEYPPLPSGASPEEVDLWKAFSPTDLWKNPSLLIDKINNSDLNNLSSVDRGIFIRAASMIDGTKGKEIRKNIYPYLFNIDNFDHLDKCGSVKEVLQNALIYANKYSVDPDYRNWAKFIEYRLNRIETEGVEVDLASYFYVPIFTNKKYIELHMAPPKDEAVFYGISNVIEMFADNYTLEQNDENRLIVNIPHLWIIVHGPTKPYQNRHTACYVVGHKFDIKRELPMITLPIAELEYKFLTQGPSV